MDVKLIVKNDGTFSIGITDGDLTKEDGFDTAINLSLFTDARAPNDRISDPKYRRGSLRDLTVKVQGRIHGSWLWLLDQSRLTPTNNNLAGIYSQQALNWMVEDGIAKSVIARSEIIPKSGFRISVVITSPTGDITTHYRNLWELTGNAN